MPGSSLLSSLSGNIGFLLSLLIAQRLCGSAVVGGAFALSAQMALLLLAVFCGPARRILNRTERVRYALLAPPAILFSAALLFVWPWLTHRSGVGPLALFTLTQTLGLALFLGTPLTGAIWHRGRRGLPWIAVYAAASLICTVVLLYRDLWAGILSATALSLVSMGIGRHSDPIPAEDAHSVEHLRQVNALRHFISMNTNVHVAVECSMQLLLCYLLALPIDSVGDAIGSAVALVLLFFASELISRRFVHSKRLSNVGRNTLYIAFAALWLLVNLRINRNAERLDVWDIYAGLAIVSLCIAMLYSVVQDMNQDIATLGTLLEEQPDEKATKALRAIFNQWIQYVSKFSLLMVLGPLALAPDIAPSARLDMPALLGKYAIPLLPGVFLLLGLAAALRQPLTHQYELKLQRYRDLRESGGSNHILEERLRLVLIQKYSKRVGIQIIKFILRPFFRLRLLHRERVDQAVFPAVFVCNHSEVYGPMAAVLNLPFYIRPWIINEMIDDKLIWEHTKGTVDRQTWLPAPIRRLVARIVVPVTVWCMRSMEPIPVYRNNIRDITRTLMVSADALQAEDNILIFPEDPTGTNGYVREGIGAFYSGFVNIAKVYHRQTGKAVTFYSVFADKHKHTLGFSHGVTYNPDAPFHEEKDRITEELHREMLQLAGICEEEKAVSL